MQALCEHYCNSVIFKLGAVKFLYLLKFNYLFDHAQFLKLIPVLNKFRKYKYFDLNSATVRVVYEYCTSTCTSSITINTQLAERNRYIRVLSY